MAVAISSSYWSSGICRKSLLTQTPRDILTFFHLVIVIDVSSFLFFSFAAAIP